MGLCVKNPYLKQKNNCFQGTATTQISFIKNSDFSGRTQVFPGTQRR